MELPLPECIESETALEDLLSQPSPQAVEALRRIEGDILLLGVAGKMGPTLARMARRAGDAAGTSRRIIGVARFSDPAKRERLESWGVETITADLLDEAALESLPDAPNIIYMTGMKFGTQGNASMTWAMNTLLPALVCRRFSGRRIVAFSTGNVYPLYPVGGRGPDEEAPLMPLGEYANSAVGRERMFEYYSRKDGTPASILRLNYACELRYGVLVDLAARIWREEPVDLSMGHFNIIWQGDANAMSLWALATVAAPPSIWNMTGPGILRVREVCETLGGLLGRTPKFVGQEAPDALLNNAARMLAAYGAPRVTPEKMMQWIAAWIQSGGGLLGKPTQFAVRDGLY